MTRTRLASIALGVLASCWVAAAGAVELRVLSAAAVQVPGDGSGRTIHARNRPSRHVRIRRAGQVDEKLSAGAHPDVVISSSGRILVSAISADAAAVRDLGTVRIGVAARKGAARPDLSSTARFRDALVRAESITYGDPARGATTGIHFSRIVDQLDLRGILAGKTILAANGLDVVQKVSRGEAELGITQVSEILHADASTLVGPLPDALQLATTYVAWTPDPGNRAARELVYLDGQARPERFRAAGFD